MSLTMTLLYLLFFWITFLISPCFCRITYPNFVQPKTEARYKGFKTLWKPYTQLYTLYYLNQTSENEITTQRTVYITIDGNLRTPVFLNDYLYDNWSRGTVKKQLILREMLVDANNQNNKYNTQKYQLVQDDPITTTTTTQTTTTTKKPPVVATSAYCYVCGLDEPSIPYTNCYDSFDNPETVFPYSRRKRKAKRHCIDGTEPNNNPTRWYGKLYKAGCFKRFTDVGTVYNERGCRTRRPYVGFSFASKRFAKLERLLYGKENGCVFSPHAELTPFSRAISLYVRYHVCVCKGKYCNRATDTTSINIYLLTAIINWLFLF